MSGKQRGLGRGLDALLGGLDKGTADPEVRLLPINAIAPNPQQPRRTFDDAGLAELAASIKGQGVLQPILVRPVQGESHDFELVAGERRWRASKIAGLDVVPVLVREMTKDESLAIALIENLQREDLNPIEEAKGLRELMDRLNVSQESLAREVGKSRSAVANTLRLLHLPENIQESLSRSEITAGHARAIMSVPDPGAQQELMQRITGQGLSVRQAEAQASHYKKNKEFPSETGIPKASPTGVVRAAKPRRSPTFDDIQERLSELFEARVKLTGNIEKGKISFVFSGKEELDYLVDKLQNSKVTEESTES